MIDVHFWVYFWTMVLIAAIGIFIALAIAVTIGGVFDLRSMFRTMREHHRAAESDDGPGEP